MPFTTDDEGVEHWIFSQPDDCDHLGRTHHEGHGCEYDQAADEFRRCHDPDCDGPAGHDGPHYQWIPE